MDMINNLKVDKPDIHLLSIEEENLVWNYRSGWGLIKNNLVLQRIIY
jgi:hypothetical protein